VSSSLEVTSEPILPPLFEGRRAAAPGEVERLALEAAGTGGPGRLMGAEAAGRLSFAVTLAPEEPLAAARRAMVAGMAALAQATVALAAPERSVEIAWPDELRYDGARLAGATLSWPRDCAEDATPDWMVLAVDVLSDRDAIPPEARSSDATSLAEEALGPGTALIELFASYLMLGFDDWSRRGFSEVARRFLDRVPGGAGLRIGAEGDLVGPDGRRALVPALGVRGWSDPVNGGVRP
jgi:hypothetical protein